MKSQARLHSDRRVWLRELDADVMSLMVVLDGEGDRAAFNQMWKWRQRILNEYQGLLSEAPVESDLMIG